MRYCSSPVAASKATAYSLGLIEEAIANYSKALEMAPENQKARITQILEGLKSQ